MENNYISTSLYDAFATHIPWHLTTSEFVLTLSNMSQLGLHNHIARLESSLEIAKPEKQRSILINMKYTLEQELSGIRDKYVYGDMIRKVYEDRIKDDVPKMLYYKSELWTLWEGDLKYLGGDTMNCFPEHLDLTYELNLFLSRIFYKPIHYIDTIQYIDKAIIELGFQEDLLEVSSIPQKIPWNGTPAEFGSVMGMLIDKGYILEISNRRNTVAVLSKFFDIRNEQGKAVDDWYLYKCFKEKKREYGNQFKIPPSDNYKTV